MSIAEDEAEEVYPTRYWNGTHVKELFDCDTDYLQEAYLRGRLAPPADVGTDRCPHAINPKLDCPKNKQANMRLADRLRRLGR